MLHWGDEITSKTTPNHDENRPIIGDVSHQQGMFSLELPGRSVRCPDFPLGFLQPRNSVQSEPYGADLPIPRSCSKSLPPHPLPGKVEKWIIF